MQLPDDIVSIIRAYAKPVSRRAISDYWVKIGIVEMSSMVTHLNYRYCYMFDQDVWHVISYIWIPRLIYTEDTLYKWSGIFKYDNSVEITIVLREDKLLHTLLSNKIIHTIQEQT